MDYCAIDFETANCHSDSAISIGLVKFGPDGMAKDAFTSLIKPSCPYFDPRCTAVHGLSEGEVMKAAPFEAIWGMVSEFIGSCPLVAHNAAFDTRVLHDSLLSRGIEAPHYEYYCTLRLAHKLIPGHASYSLSRIVPEVLGFTYKAHDALDDAMSCGKLFHFLVDGHLGDKEDLDEFLSSRRISYPKTIC